MLEGGWRPDGRYYAFGLAQTLATGISSSIWAVRETRGLFDRANSAPVRLTNDSRSYYAPLPSRDGKKLFVVGEDRDGELVRYDSRDRVFVPYLGGLEARWVAFSPDGRWVAYTKASDGTLWRARLDGTGQTQLMFGPMITNGVCWSPDGQRIALRARTPNGPFKIYIVPAFPKPDSIEATPPEQLLPDDNQEEGIPTWSKDGKQIAFGEVPLRYMEGTGAEVIHLCDAKTRKRSVLPGMKGVWTPRWSPDGRYILAVTTDPSQRLQLFNLIAHRWQDLGVGRVNNPTWSRDSSYVYYEPIDPRGTAIWRVRVSEGKVELAAPLNGMRLADVTWLGLAPDDSPIVLRDIGIQEIYALDVDWT